MVTFSDDFNRADVTPLDNGWTGWPNRGYGIFGGQCGPDTTGTHASRAPVEPTSDKIFAEVTYSVLADGTFTGPAVCMPLTMGTSASNTAGLYVLWATGTAPNSVSIRYKPPNGNVTSLSGGTGTATAGHAFAPGDVMRLEADLDPTSGETLELRGYINGVLKVQYNPAATQMVIDQRGVGLYTGTAKTTQRFDSFSGGDATSGPIQTTFYSTTNYAGPASLLGGTTDKPQSKLFYTNGQWFGVFPSDTAPYLHIWRYSKSTHSWTSTGTTIDSSSTAHADVLWDEATQTLFVATADTGQPSLLYTYSYAAGTDAFTNVISGLQLFGSGETVTIALDSLGRLWAATEVGTAMQFMHSTTDFTTWTTPADIPGVPAADSDDICAVVKLDSDKIAVIWPSQIDNNIYFAVHNDADPDSIWNTEIAWEGVPSGADDHINVKTAADGSVFAVTKHFDERLSLLWRTPAGVWGNVEVAPAGVRGTRPQVVLDETYGRVVVLYTQLGGGHVVMRTAPMASPADLESATNVIDKLLTGNEFDDVTTSKQAWTGASGGLLIATGEAPVEIRTVEAALGTVPGFASLTATPATTSSGAKGARALGELGASATLSSAGERAVPPALAGTGLLSLTATLTGTGARSATERSGTGSISASVALLATGGRTGAQEGVAQIDLAVNLLATGWKATLGTGSLQTTVDVLSGGLRAKWVFTPPTVREVPLHVRRHGLLGRVALDVGISVLKKDGFYRQVRGPAPQEIDDADVVYLGGHDHVVDDDEYLSLQAAGYGAYLHPGSTG